MLYFGRKDLGNILNPDGIYYGEGRGEVGICLHLPFQSHYHAGSASGEDYLAMLGIANNMIEYLLYKRVPKGPEQWDYDADKTSELYEVCGDNPNTSGIILFDSNYSMGPKIQIFLDKTFGANEAAIRWKNQMVADEKLLGQYEEYMKQALRDGSLLDTGKEKEED